MAVEQLEELDAAELDEIDVPPLPPPDDFDDDGDGDDDGNSDGGSGPWVTVATFWQSPEAHIARLRLESEEIECVIVDENLVAMDWLFANAVGGIKLQVPAAHAQRATELLTTRSPTPQDEPIFDGEARCPRCGGDQIFTPRFSKRVAFLCILFLGLPIPFFNRNRRCVGCGFEWPAEDRPAV